MISKSPFQPYFILFYFFYDSVINIERSLASLLLKIMWVCGVFCNGIPDFLWYKARWNCVCLCGGKWDLKLQQLQEERVVICRKMYLSHSSCIILHHHQALYKSRKKIDVIFTPFFRFCSELKLMGSW